MPEQQQESVPASSSSPDSARVMPQESPREVVITRLDIPFLNLLVFFIKAGLASIPAAIIVGIIYMVVVMIFGGTFMGGMGGRHW